MTVDQIIINLLNIKNYYNDENIKPYVGFSKMDNDIVDGAIKYLMEYKQVEQSLQNTCIRVECNPEVIAKIKKAIETSPFNIRG